MVFSSFLGGAVFGWASQNPFQPNSFLSSNVLKLITITTAICFVLFFAGGRAGESVLLKRIPDVSIALVNGKKEIGVLVWTSAETVFIRDDIRKIKLIPRNQIANVELFGVNDWTPIVSVREVWSWLTMKDAEPSVAH